MAANFSLTGTVRLVPTWTEPLDLVDIVDRTTIAQTITLTDGDGAGEADCYWRDVRTVAAAATDTLNLASLSLNVYGGSDTLSLSTVKLVYIRNLSTTISLRYYVQGGSVVGVPPGGVMLWRAGTGAAAGYEMLADGSLIEVQNSGGSSAQYEIVLVGVKS